MLGKIVNKDNPCIGDNNESLEIVEIFKYLGPKMCGIPHLEVGKRIKSSLHIIFHVVHFDF